MLHRPANSGTGLRRAKGVPPLANPARGGSPAPEPAHACRDTERAAPSGTARTVMSHHAR